MSRACVQKGDRVSGAVTPATPSEERVVAIDQFRGLAIMLMVAANYFGGVSGVPNWLKHEPDVGLTAVDLVAPLFIFAIGLTYGLSARRRAAREGRAQMAMHFVRRYLAILGIGAVITGVHDYAGRVDVEGWGVLQAIGMSGLLALPVVCAGPVSKALTGVGVLAGYQYVLDRYWVDRVLRSSHGGLPGSLGWGAMLILASALADEYHSGTAGRRRFHWGVFAAGLGGLLLSMWIPISKNRVSASYVLLSLGISGALFLVSNWVLGRLDLRLLVAWGQNPLLLYVLHLALLGVLVLPGRVGWYSMASPTLMAAQLAGLLGIISLIAWWLYRRGVVLAL